VEGVCKLCKTTTKLCNSHIIPEFAYEHVYVYPSKNNRRLQTISFEKNSEPKLTNMQKGIREYLLCSECEGKFSKWEKLVVELLRNELSNYKSGFIYLNVNYSYFRLFELSILWRCAITTHNDFHFDVGEKHSEILRLMLYNEDVGNNFQYPCLTSLLKSNDNIDYDLILTDEGKRVDGLRVYRVIFFGLIWSFYVGNKNHRLSDRRIEEAFLTPGGKLTIVPSEMKDVEFLKKRAEKMYS
jgi:hypothetical protein